MIDYSRKLSIVSNTYRTLNLCHTTDQPIVKISKPKRRAVAERTLLRRMQDGEFVTLTR